MQVVSDETDILKELRNCFRRGKLIKDVVKV